MSIIVATRDRAHELSATLRSMERLQVPEGWQAEVLLADNGSVDETPKLIEAWETRPGLAFQVRGLSAPGGGKSAALNQAMDEAKSEVFAFTDDDMGFTPGWLKAFLSHLEGCDCVGVQGSVEVEFPEGRPSYITRRAEILLGASYGMEGEGGPPHLTGGNMAVRADHARAVGGFRCDLGPEGRRTGYSEDVEWSRRLAERGRLCYVPEARLSHRIPAGRASRWFLWKRQLGYARTEWLLRGEQGQFPSLGAEVFNELRGLLGALLIRRRRFEGFDYGLELAVRTGRLWSLLELLRMKS